MASRKINPLTPKEQAFVKEYVSNGENGTQAALQVIETNSSNPSNVAGVTAHELLKRPNVQDAIANSRKEVIEAFDVVFKQALTIAQRWLRSDDEEIVAKGMKWVENVTKAMAPQSPKSVTDARRVMMNLPNGAKG